MYFILNLCSFEYFITIIIILLSTIFGFLDPSGPYDYFQLNNIKNINEIENNRNRLFCKNYRFSSQWFKKPTKNEMTFSPIKLDKYC